MTTAKRPNRLVVIPFIPPLHVNCSLACENSWEIFKYFKIPLRAGNNAHIMRNMSYRNTSLDLFKLMKLMDTPKT